MNGGNCASKVIIVRQKTPITPPGSNQPLSDALLISILHALKSCQLSLSLSDRQQLYFTPSFVQLRDVCSLYTDRGGQGLCLTEMYFFLDSPSQHTSGLKLFMQYSQNHLMYTQCINKTLHLKNVSCGMFPSLSLPKHQFQLLPIS